MPVKRGSSEGGASANGCGFGALDGVGEVWLSGNGFRLTPERGATPSAGKLTGELTKFDVIDTGDGIEIGAPKTPVEVCGPLIPLPVRGARGAGAGDPPLAGGGVVVGTDGGARRPG